MVVATAFGNEVKDRVRPSADIGKSRLQPPNPLLGLCNGCLRSIVDAAGRTRIKPFAVPTKSLLLVCEKAVLTLDDDDAFRVVTARKHSDCSLDAHQPDDSCEWVRFPYIAAVAEVGKLTVGAVA